MDEKYRRRVKDAKPCAMCGVEKPREEFSDRQWSQGQKSKCKQCILQEQIGSQVKLVPCIQCQAQKPKSAYTKTQLDQPHVVGSKCRDCCNNNLKTSQQWVKEKAKMSEAKGDGWVKGDKEEAMRWVMEAPEDALPSVCRKSYCAMQALKGRINWVDKTPQKDQSGMPFKDNGLDRDPRPGIRTNLIIIRKGMTGILKQK